MKALEKSNFQSMRDRIDKASGVESLQRLEQSMTRLWDVGAFTVSEFQRLDARLYDRMMERGEG